MVGTSLFIYQHHNDRFNAMIPYLFIISFHFTVSELFLSHPKEEIWHFSANTLDEFDKIIGIPRTASVS